jgi:hypothetical protein
MARVNIELTKDMEQLLRDVKAGKVARHRMRRGQSPALGDDRQELPFPGPGNLRKAARRVALLKRYGLVELPAGDDAVVSWPWKTTELGDLALEALDKLDEQEGPDRR